MNTIWIDITTLLAWKRPAVGIVRVEAECVRYALTHTEHPVRFCAFDQLNGYREIGADQVKSCLDSLGKPSADASPSVPVHFVKPRLSTEERLKQLLRKLLCWLPEQPRARLFLILRNRRHHFQELLQGMRHIKSAIKQLLRPVQAAPTQPPQQTNSARGTPPFARSDIYISLGLDWDDKDLAYLHALKRKLDLKILLCCHDVIPVKLPHLCVESVSAMFSRYFANVAWNADKIVCVSRCSERDLLSMLDTLGTPIPKTVVINHGSELPPALEAPEDTIGVPYILYVSTIERRKNHETLYRAYTRLLDRGEKNLPKLIFVGMHGWGIDGLLADLKLDPRTQGLIEIRGHVNDAELASLYKNALFTVYPSLYEGWGLPVAESLAYGKFCLASNAASIPEVGGELVDYVDPWDIPAWADRLGYYFANPNEIRRREQLIADSYKAKPWSVTASEILTAAASLSPSGEVSEKSPTAETHLR